MLDQKIPYGVNHTVAEAGALALGGALIELLGAAVEKYLPTVNAKLIALPGGETVVPLLAGIGLGNLKGSSPAMKAAQIIGKGLVGASVVTIGNDIAFKVTGRAILAASPTAAAVSQAAAIQGIPSRGIPGSTMLGVSYYPDKMNAWHGMSGAMGAAMKLPVGRADIDLGGVTAYRGGSRSDFGYRPDAFNPAADFGGKIQYAGRGMGRKRAHMGDYTVGDLNWASDDEQGYTTNVDDDGQDSPGDRGNLDMSPEENDAQMG